MSVRLLSLVTLAWFSVAALAQHSAPTGPALDAKLADEVHRVLVEHNLRPWLPRCVDAERGGFNETYDETWQRVSSDDQRSLIFQSRMVWTSAAVAEAYPELKQEYLGYARHGLKQLQDVFTDKQHGGLYFQRMPDGSSTEFFRDEKHAYAMSFAIYAAAAAHKVDPDAGALQLAIDTFRWLDKHGHDEQHGGYLEAFKADGTPILEPSQTDRGKPFDCIGTLYGYKDQNTHLHLLEAFTELYRVWPDPLLRTRLEELFEIMSTRIQVEPGCLVLYFTRDWRPLPDHDSFGHDVEAAYLLVEAAEALGKPEDPRTWTIARRLIDHALAYGWDKENGGFFDKGSAFKQAHDRTKIWWAQAEGLNTLMLMHQRFGKETPIYGQRFLQMWRFMTTHQLDHENMGWYTTIGPDGVPAPGQNKSGHWKEPYHAGRALMNVERRLRKLPAELYLQPEPPSPQPGLSAVSADLRIEKLPGANPWTHLDFKTQAKDFQFAIVSDNAGGMRPGPFARAVKTLNLLQPDFVMSVGDFINGYKPTPGEINGMWEAFLPHLKPLQPPFFFVIGNHDSATPVMRPIWNERFGREYYHFIYRDVLFLCMNGIDRNNTRGLGQEQIEYFRKVLADNPNPRWTFVFSHCPLWHESKDVGWKDFEPLLSGRRYTVIAGHEHQYLKEIRNGNEYYTLSVTGGANMLRGPSFGDFDQIAWVTMSGDAPQLANIDINHVHPSNIRTPANKSIAYSVDNSVKFTPLRVRNESVSTISAEMVIQNWTDVPGRITGSIQSHPSLTISPRTFDVTLQPKTRQAFALELRADRPINSEDLRPLVFEGTAKYEVADDSPSTWPISSTLVIDRQEQIPPADRPIAVDGQLTEWGELQQSLERPRTITGNESAFSGAADASARFALRHESGNLFIAVSVTDDQMALSEDARDGVELWLDARPDSARLSGLGAAKDMFTRVLRLTIHPADGQTPARLVEEKDLPPGTRFATARTDKGYDVEISIPAAYLNEKSGKADGWKDVRLNVSLYDTDASGESPAQLWWRPAWQSKENHPGSGTFAQ